MPRVLAEAGADPALAAMNPKTLKQTLMPFAKFRSELALKGGAAVSEGRHGAAALRGGPPAGEGPRPGLRAPLWACVAAPACAVLEQAAGAHAHRTAPHGPQVLQDRLPFDEEALLRENARCAACRPGRACWHAPARRQRRTRPRAN